MSDEPILKTPGELLAEARAASGLSLAVIAERTKIPVPQLQAIERDEYHRLSGALYVKSFLRSYAEAVGADVETVLDLYRRASGEGATQVTEGRAETWERETVTITRVGTDWGRLGLWGGIGAVVVVALWFGIRLVAGLGGHDAEPGPRPAAALVGADGQAAAQPDSAVADSLAAAPADTLPAGAPPAVDREPQREPERPSPRQETPQAAQAVPEETAPRRGELPSALTGTGPIPFSDGGRWPVRVCLLVKEPLLAEARSDGESRFQPAVFAGAGPEPLPARGIVAGTAYAVREGYAVYWHAADHVGLRLERTDGVVVSVNGEVRDLGLLHPGQELILDAHR